VSPAACRASARTSRASTRLRAPGRLRGAGDPVEQGAGLLEAGRVPVGPVLPDEQARQRELVELG
jgi:hypothetical protein